MKSIVAAGGHGEAPAAWRRSEKRNGGASVAKNEIEMKKWRRIINQYQAKSNRKAKSRKRGS
jgi:hypothetical protein